MPFTSFIFSRKFEESLNTTFISLIPNEVRATYIKDFRSISLVSGVHKIIFKVLASRLKTVLEKVISRSINVVIRVRQILGSVLVANECLDSQIRSGEPSVFLILGLEKAFDHISWDFLLYLLR